MQQPRILSQLRGRVRISLPGWQGEEASWVSARLRRLEGVQSAELNSLTGNVLFRFDSRRTSAEAIRAGTEAVMRELAAHRTAKRDQAEAGVPARRRQALVRAGLYGLVGHALVDAVFYTITFAQPFGLPLAGLGVLHLGFDALAWTAACAPLLAAAVGPGPRPAAAAA